MWESEISESEWVKYGGANVGEQILGVRKGMGGDRLGERVLESEICTAARRLLVWVRFRSPICFRSTATFQAR